MRGTFFMARQGDIGAERATALSAGHGPRNRADPGHWRALADQARRNADRVRDPNIKATILTIAERFERFALRAHELERAHDVRPLSTCNKSRLRGSIQGWTNG